MHYRSTMNTSAPSPLIVDARYTMYCTDGANVLVALHPDGLWRLWDATGSEWIGDGYMTSGDCYFATLTAVEAEQGI